MDHDLPSHILVSAIHRNRAEIREIFLREMPGVDPDLTDEPRVLAMAAWAHLRRKFPKVGISGANVADLEVFLQLLSRSSTGERMNPHTSVWIAVTPGDGPQTFHLVPIDNGRTAVLADEVGRSAPYFIRSRPASTCARSTSGPGGTPTARYARARSGRC